MSGPSKRSCRRWLAFLLPCLLLAGLAGSHADVDEETLAEALRQPHAVQPSNFEVFMRMAGEGSALSRPAQRKLQEVVKMKHWTEVTYGIPYNKDAEKWVDPLADSSKLVQWGIADEDSANQQQLHQGRLLAGETERKLIRSGRGKSLGLSAVGNMGPSMASMNGSLFRWESTQAPSSVDWRTTSAITVVKTQGQCASCWVLAAADAISMMSAIGNGVGKTSFNPVVNNSRGDPQFGLWGKMDASPQEICDCGLGTCCKGGWPESAFSYVKDNGGVSEWQKYPYFRMDSTCKAELKQHKKFQISGWESVPARNPEAARKAVAQQPFLAFISASSHSFQTYLGGYYDDDCGEDLDHVVVVVGYGDSDLGPYWIIKNSWGHNWGEGGYMYLAAKPGKGKCGIHAAPGLYPVNYPSNGDPCKALPNPCGGGTCYSAASGSARDGTLTKEARCGCPSGYVENNQTKPAKCIKADPCSANPNPCGCGVCTNMRDGSYACSCPDGHKVGARTDGAATCVAKNKQGGASTVTVMAGTTIEDVVKGYKLTTEELVKLNPWVDPTKPDIPPGAVLAISPSTSTSGCVATYIVQPKDTCASIAAAHSLSAAQLAAENPLVSCRALVHGTELCLSQASLTNENNIPPQCGQLYEVQEGDTCTSVKQAMGMSGDLFTTLNAGVKCNKPLDPGMVLCTAVGTGSDPNCTQLYTVQHGDTCASIWLMANLTQPEFFLLNQGFRCTTPYLQVGQQVCLDSPSLAPEPRTGIPYIVQQGDTLDSISLSFSHRCGLEASSPNICAANALPGNCGDPPAGALLHIPCKTLVGRSCGCVWDYNPYFGADGVWYQNYCDANCNYGLPAVTYETFCKKACKDRAGLTPLNDPNYYCTRPCPWPQWNPQPSNWWWFASTFSGYYIGACQDWCSASATTICTARGDWSNWDKYYNDCVAACRQGKC